MPGARLLLEELIAAKIRDGEEELAHELRAVADKLPWSPGQPIPNEVYAIYAAHFASNPISHIVCCDFSAPKIH